MEALDVLAHNLANLNTTGFKEQKTFYSLMNQALDEGVPDYYPKVPEHPQLETIISTAASNVCAGTQTPEAAAKDVNQKVYDVMERAGYYQ